MIFGIKKTRVMGLSCGIICVILHLAVLLQYRSVTNTQTDGQTDTRRRHIPHLALLALRCAVKMVYALEIVTSTSLMQDMSVWNCAVVPLPVA